MNYIKSLPIWTNEEQLILLNKSKTLKEVQYLLPSRTRASIVSRASRFKRRFRELYTKDENFFNTPNLENCHISGFLGGDGCISKDEGNRSRIYFLTNIKDIGYLENIKNLTNYTGPIIVKSKKFKIKNMRNPNDINKPYYEGEQEYARLEFYSCRQWANDLCKNWNLIPNKTKRLIAPNLIDLKLQLAYICGSIDADGSIYRPMNKGKIEHLKISMLGTEILLNWFREIFARLTPNIDNCIVKLERPGASIFQYGIMGVKAYIVSKMILSLGLYKMARKWGISEKYIDYIENDFDKLSHKMQQSLIKNISPEIINFVSNTPQAFSSTFLEKIGYKTPIPSIPV
jgi:hypothetical protein